MRSLREAEVAAELPLFLIFNVYVVVNDVNNNIGVVPYEPRHASRCESAETRSALFSVPMLVFVSESRDAVQGVWQSGGGSGAGWNGCHRSGVLRQLERCAEALANRRSAIYDTQRHQVITRPEPPHIRVTSVTGAGI